MRMSTSSASHSSTEPPVGERIRTDLDNDSLCEAIISPSQELSGDFEDLISSVKKLLREVRKVPPKGEEPHGAEKPNQLQKLVLRRISGDELESIRWEGLGAHLMRSLRSLEVEVTGFYDPLRCGFVLLAEDYPELESFRAEGVWLAPQSSVIKKLTTLNLTNCAPSVFADIEAFVSMLYEATTLETLELVNYLSLEGTAGSYLADDREACERRLKLPMLKKLRIQEHFPCTVWFLRRLSLRLSSPIWDVDISVYVSNNSDDLAKERIPQSFCERVQSHGQRTAYFVPRTVYPSPCYRYMDHVDRVVIHFASEGLTVTVYHHKDKDISHCSSTNKETESGVQVAAEKPAADRVFKCSISEWRLQEYPQSVQEFLIPAVYPANTFEHLTVLELHANFDVPSVSWALWSCVLAVTADLQKLTIHDTGSGRAQYFLSYFRQHLQYSNQPSYNNYDYYITAQQRPKTPLLALQELHLQNATLTVPDRNSRARNVPAPDVSLVTNVEATVRALTPVEDWPSGTWNLREVTIALRPTETWKDKQALVEWFQRWCGGLGYRAKLEKRGSAAAMQVLVISMPSR